MNELLKKIYLELGDYFHDENLVKEALVGIKIVNSNSIYDALKSKKLLNNFASNSFERLKVVGGLYLSVPYAKLENKKYDVYKVKRYVMLAKFDKDKEQCVGALIHELCHVIKSYKDEFTIKGDYLVNSSGVLKKNFKLNDNFQIINAKIDYAALEEALTVFQEEEIMNRLGYLGYISESYLGSTTMIRDLISTFDLEEMIIRCELNHDVSELKDYMGFYFDEFMNILTETFKIDTSIVNISGKFERKEKLDEVMDYISTNYYPLKEKMKLHVRGR